MKRYSASRCDNNRTLGKKTFAKIIPKNADSEKTEWSAANSADCLKASDGPQSGEQHRGEQSCPIEDGTKWGGTESSR